MGGSQQVPAAALAVGQRFAEERERLDLSRADLAFATGYSAEQIRKVELGERMPGGELLAALLALHGDVSYVLAGSDKMGEVRGRITPAYDADAFPTMEELAVARQAAKIKNEAKEWARQRADRRKKLLTDDEADLVEIYRQLSRVNRAHLLDTAEKVLAQNEMVDVEKGASGVRADNSSIAAGGDVNIGAKSGRRHK